MLAEFSNVWRFVFHVIIKFDVGPVSSVFAHPSYLDDDVAFFVEHLSFGDKIAELDYFVYHISTII